MLNTKSMTEVSRLYILDRRHSDLVYRYIYLSDTKTSVLLSIYRY